MVRENCQHAFQIATYLNVSHQKMVKLLLLLRGAVVHQLWLTKLCFALKFFTLFAPRLAVELQPYPAALLCTKKAGCDMLDGRVLSLRCICLSTVSFLLQIMEHGLSYGLSLITTSTDLSLTTLIDTR